MTDTTLLPGEGHYCDRCGETFKPDDNRAELGSTAANPDFDPPPDNFTVIVHAEPCAEELIRTGHWEVA